jgi:hypothetical protein
MAGQKLLQFPMHDSRLFSAEINCQVLGAGRLSRTLYAAIRALPHVHNELCRDELKQALCDLIFDQPGRLA